MKVLLVLSVLTWTLVQNTAGNLLEVGGGGYGGYYQPYQPQPVVPVQPAPAAVETVVSPTPTLCQLGAAAQVPGACACQGYSIQICPFAVAEEVEEVVVPEHKIAEIIDVKLVDEVTGQILGEEIEEFDVTGQFYPYTPYGLSPFPGGGSYYPPQVPMARYQQQLVQPMAPIPQIVGGYQAGYQTGYGLAPQFLPGASRFIDEVTGEILVEGGEVLDVTTNFYPGETRRGQGGYAGMNSPYGQRPAGYYQQQQPTYIQKQPVYKQQQVYSAPSYAPQSYSSPKYSAQSHSTPQSYNRPAYNRLQAGGFERGTATAVRSLET